MSALPTFPDCKWKLAPVGAVVQLENGYPFDSSSFSPMADIPLVRIRDLSSEMFETFVPGPVPERVLLRDGDLVIGMDGNFNVIRWARGPAALNQRLCRLRARGTTDLRFVGYCLPSALGQINATQFSTTVKHLSSSEILRIRIPLPPLETQRRIANYLDDQVGRIDHACDLYRKQAKLLKERKTTVITQAVLSQMDIGTLKVGAAGSASVPLRRVAKLVNGGTPSPDTNNWGGDVIWATPVDLGRCNGGVLGETDRTITSTGLATGSATVPSGSLIVSTRAPIGYIVRTVTTTAFNQGCRGIIPDQHLDVSFLGFWLAASNNSLQRLGNGSTFQELSTESLAGFGVPLPPLDVQRQIADYLDDQVSRMNKASELCLQQVQLLQERKRSLITATVTGQRDPATVANSGVTFDERKA